MEEYNNFKQKMLKNPHKLFLIDGLGACLSLGLYLGVVIPFIEFFGVTKEKIFILAGLAFLYAIFSLTCYFTKVKRWRPFMKTISILNLFHWCLTMWLILFTSGVTIIGTFYFVGESIIVVALATFEWKLTLVEDDRFEV